MKRTHFVSNVSDDSLKKVLEYINDLHNILLEDAKKNDSSRKDIDEDDAFDDEDEYYNDEEARDDAAFANFDRKHVTGYDDFQSDYDYYRNSPKMFNPYDEDEDDDDDYYSKYSGEHFGAGFEIDEPRPEDYTDSKTFEDDLAAYERFVEAGEECVRRGLEKPEWANSVKIDDVSDDVDDDIDDDVNDEPSANVKVFILI